MHIFSSKIIKFFMGHLDFNIMENQLETLLLETLCLNFAFNWLGFHEQQSGASSSCSLTYKTCYKTGTKEEEELHGLTQCVWKCQFCSPLSCHKYCRANCLREDPSSYSAFENLPSHHEKAHNVDLDLQKLGWKHLLVLFIGRNCV